MYRTYSTYRNKQNPDLSYQEAKSEKNLYFNCFVTSSVGDPDRQDPHGFGPPGSESISQRT
jgi:hypothetical protein